MHQEASIPLQDLLAHAPWARRLAQHLVSDQAAADDLVQETWLAALRHPPSADRPARPWLRQVLANVARMRHRGEGRRSRREQAALSEPEAHPQPTSPEELLGRLEAHRLVATALAELAEPFRQTLLLRYYEGHSAAEIARLTGAPAGTVRWRLQEGLARLRASLDEQTSGGRDRWCALLLPLAQAAGAPAAGGVAMVKSSAVKPLLVASAALVIVVAAVIATQRWHRGGPGATPQASVALSGGTAPSAARVTPPGALPAASAAPRVASEPPTVEACADASGAIEGVVVSWGSGRAVPGAELSLLCGGAVSTVSADAAGRFRLAPEQPGRCSLASVSAAGFLPFAPALDLSLVELRFRARQAVRGLRLYLTPALTYHGAVVDPQGRPVAGAAVSLPAARAGEQTLVGIRGAYTTDAEGKFTFHAPDGATLVARHPGFGAGRARLDRSAQIMHALTIRLRAAGTPEPRIAGRVVDGAGAAVPDASVLAVPDAAVVAGVEGPAAEAGAGSAHATTDSEGRFVLEGLPAGACSLTARSAAGRVATVRAAAGEEKALLRLAAGLTLRGRVVGGAGRRAPIGAFTLVAAAAGAEATTLRQALVADPEGRFELGGLVPGSYTVSASAAGFAPAEVTVALPAREEVELALPLGGSLSGVVSSVSGAPLADARVTLERLRPLGSLVAPSVASTTTDEAGRFELRGLPAGTRAVLVAAYRHAPRLLGGLAIEEGRALGPLRVTLTPSAEGEQPKLELVGVGLQLRATAEGLQVLRAIPGGSAAEAGIAAGDLIRAIEESSTRGLPLEDAVGRLRGEAGTSVRVRVLTPGGSERSLTLPRRALKL